MAFQQGLSGLNVASKALDVISNNVANSNTVGFKVGRAEFADVYASALNGAGAGLQVGIGATLSAVTQSFLQGNITATHNPLDVAINGNGFFRMAAPDGSIAYTRNGQFDISKDGFVVSAQGYRLTGYGTDASGNIRTGVIGEIVVDATSAGGAPQQTGSSQRVGSGPAGLTVSLNLDARSHIPTTSPFSAADPNSYNSATSLDVFDSVGNPHLLTMYFVRNGTPADPAATPPVAEVLTNDWTVYYQVDGVDVPPTSTMSFDTGGVLTSPSPVTGPAFADLFGANVTPGLPTSELLINFTSTTQHGYPFGVNGRSQDGFAPGRLTRVSIDDDGIILATYSNGRSRHLGQVVLANFRSPNGLISLGGNMWAESAASGEPAVGTPGSANIGVLSAGAIEEANVDLTGELVQLIIQQRAYQANAQSVRAQDQILQTIVNLR